MAERQRLLTWVAETRRDLVRLGELATATAAVWDRRLAASPEDRPFLIESTALRLHNFYNGWENIWSRIASEFNGAVPEGGDWHLRLLRSMALEVPEARPAVLDEETVRRLGDYLRFRHLVRNIYAFDLDAERIAPLVAGLGALALALDRDLGRFVAYVATLTASAQGDED